MRAYTFRNYGILKLCCYRTECYTDCNKAYFPEIQCTQSSIHFKYNGIKYDNFYQYKRPDPKKGQQGVEHYEECKGYIGSNGAYPWIPHLNRQARIHTCFSYCINGDDPNVIGETRVNCVDLPPSERDQIICLYPQETCEMTSVASEFGPYDFAISPEIAINAMLIVTPLQFIFELMCIILARMKGKPLL